MNRQIVKVLAVLLVLLCILPAAAGAAEYKVGDTLWTAGEKPTADTEQYSRWIPVIRPDNAQEYREVGKTGTYEYQWIVEEYYGPGEKKGIPTSLTVKNVDRQGKPMVGTEFIVFEERGENLLLIASAITDSEGVAVLKDLCLDDNSDTAVWHLVQTNFPESKMAETHHPYTGMWDIYVTRDSGGVHTMDVVPAVEQENMTLASDGSAAEDKRQIIDFAENSGKEPVKENYNEEENVLTLVNAEITGELTISVMFEDGIVPPGIENFAVVLMPPDNYPQTVRLSTRFPEVTLINMPLGEYSIEQQTHAIQVDGYNLKTSYTVQRVDEDPVEGQSVTLDEEKTAATITVMNCYEEISIANTILAKVVDKDGKLLNGAELELLDENNGLIRTVSATSETGIFVFDDLADYAEKDKTVTFKIRQTKAPSGYEMSDYEYVVSVVKNKGKVTVSAVKNENFLIRLFNSGKDTGLNGETVIEFENKANYGNLALEIMNTGDVCPVNEITVSVNGQNDSREVTLSAENGWKENLEKLPMGKYTIRQNAKAEGYHLTEDFNASGAIVTGNQVELKRNNAGLKIINTYSLETAKLVVEMKFADGLIPETVKNIPVTVTGSALYAEKDIAETVIVSAANGWKAELDLPLGNYTVVQDVTSAKAEGYELIPDPVQSKKVTLAEEGEEKTCTITNQYEESKTPLPEKIVIQMQDASGNPVAGAKVGIFEIGAGSPIREFGPSGANGQIVIENLKSMMDLVSAMLSEGEKQELIVKQTAVPAGYEKSAQEYKIVVEKTNGELVYGVDGVDTSGTEILVTFTNLEIEAETGNLAVTVKFEDKPAAADVAKITVSAKNSATGVLESKDITAADGWKATFVLPVGEYTISQNVINVTGYAVTTTYVPQKVTVAKDKTVTCEITNQFKESTASSDKVIPEKITIQVQDDENKPVSGAKIGLFEAGAAYPLREVGPSDDNGKIVIGNLKNLMDVVSAMLTEGQKEEITVKQTAVPAGYEKSTKEYKIVAEKKNGELIYGVEGVDTSGTEVVVTFTNAKIKQDVPVIPEKITIQMLDAEKKTVPGVKIGLFETGASYPLREFGPSDANGQIVVDNLKSYMGVISTLIQEGEKKEIIVKQTSVPEGYVKSKQEYKIVAEKKDGELLYRVDGVDTSGTNVQVDFTTVKADYGNLNIAVKFTGKPNTFTVSKVTVSAKHSVTNEVVTKEITAADGWVGTMELLAGEYTISQQKLSATGYNVTSTCSPQKVTITKDGTANCEIQNQFKKTTTPSNPDSSDTEERTNQIGIRTLDTSGAPMAGAKYGLYCGATAIRSYTDYGTGQINIEDLDMLLGNYVNDYTILNTPLTLQQTQPPLGGERSMKTYDVYVFLDDMGEMRVNVKGSEIDANGVQLVDFIHTASEPAQPTQATTPNNKDEDKEPEVIVIRTVDESGNALSGAEYCLSTDLRYDQDKDIVYSKADRHDEITIEDFEELVDPGKKATYYLLQSRQPDGGNLSAERYVVELSRKKGKLDIEVKKDAGILERLQGGGVEESTTGEWIVTFCSSAKTTTIQIDYEEVVDWHNCMEAEDVLQQYKKSEYAFQLNWEYAGEEKEPLTLKLSNGESGSFDPIPFGAKYEVVPVEEGAYKLEFTKGELKGVASKANEELKAKITYNIDKDAPLTLQMLKIDSRSEKPLPGVAYVLKNAEKEEVDVYKTDSTGKLVIDGITEPGEYTLTETEVPEGYNKLNKDIGISVSVGFKEAEDGNGDPMIVQTLDAVVSHSQVRQKLDGTYRIGTVQNSSNSNLPIILGACAAAAVAAGAGAAVLLNKKKKGSKK